MYTRTTGSRSSRGEAFAHKTVANTNGIGKIVLKQMRRRMKSFPTAAGFSEGEETAVSAQAGFTPPAPAELAARFPHLEVIELLERCFRDDPDACAGRVQDRR